ncbi:hypothetical protein TNIN_207241 [Trichonephila inaurata madagascariensis]|uniref:Uncharacterized protein n=1 Tax=Trichonephila inaurata madagascariensis TaxID=2747483 RepID=A0A8X7C7P7_9ARAC|nr:hypothetical protein TNIN_207241 [Trichonephila inaurata madagascariensis]
MDQTCGLGSSLTRPQPIGLFLLGAHEIFNARDACGLVEDLVARELLPRTKLTRHQEFSTGTSSGTCLGLVTKFNGPDVFSIGS